MAAERPGGEITRHRRGLDYTGTGERNAHGCKVADPGACSDHDINRAAARPPVQRSVHRLRAIGSMERERQASRVDDRGIRPPRAYTLTRAPAPEGVVLLRLEGELDMAAAPALRGQIDAARAEG